MRPLLAALLLASLLPAAPLRAVQTGDPKTDAALKRLVCTCGGCPKLSLDRCTCGRAEELAAEALALSRQGRDPDAIVAAFVARYGPQILAAPPASGFDLTLWIAPFVVLLAGAVCLAVFLFLRSRRARGRELDEPPPAAAAGAEPLLADFDPFA